MVVRPYALPGRSALAAVRRALEGALDAWCADWGVPRQQFGVDCQRAADGGTLNAPAWRQARGADEALVWLGWTQELAPQLQRLMFAPDRRHGPQGATAPRMAAAAAETALSALADALAQTTLKAVLSDADGFGRVDQPDDGDPAPPPQVWLDGAGTVRAEIRIGKHACTCLLSHAVVRALAPTPVALPTLAPVHYAAALDHLPVLLHVGIGGAEVGLGSLMALGVGDVIRLDTLAEQPLAIQGPNGAVLFGGYLGTVDGALAVEVVSAKAVSTNLFSGAMQ